MQSKIVAGDGVSMQLLSYLSVFSCLLFAYSCETTTESTNTTAQEKRPAYITADSSISAKTDSSLSEKAFIRECSSLEITPVDESGTDTSLLRFITHLKRVVSEKNTAALLNLIGPRTITSHGGSEAGKEDFTRYWHLEKNPDASEVWPKLERAIALGGCFDKGTNKPDFIMPYLQASHHFEKNCELDWFTTCVSLKPKTKIYQKPANTSKVIAELKYRLLETYYDAKMIDSLVPVHTIDKSIQGYVHEQDVYLFADYMLVIGKEYGKWSIKSFSPYD